MQAPENPKISGTIDNAFAVRRRKKNESTWDNWENVFAVGYNGAMYANSANIEGVIRAKTGNIGYVSASEPGWTIKQKAIYNGLTDAADPGTSGASTSTGTYIGTDGIKNLNGTNYVLIKNGTIKANNVNLTGIISASEGKIGNWVIGTGQKEYNGSLYYLPSGSSFGNENTILFNPLGVTNNIVIGYRQAEDWVITVGNNFGISKNGHVEISDATIGRFTVNGNGFSTTVNGISTVLRPQSSNTNDIAFAVGATYSSGSINPNSGKFRVYNDGSITMEGTVTFSIPGTNTPAASGVWISHNGNSIGYYGGIDYGNNDTSLRISAQSSIELTAQGLLSGGTIYLSGTVVNIGCSTCISVTGKGYNLTDASGTSYGGLYENGNNLWIGAASSTSPHHRGTNGNTYISAGYNTTNSAGNGTIYISVPSLSGTTWSHTSYAVLHSGNYSSYALPKSGGTITGGLTINGNLTFTSTNDLGIIQGYNSTTKYNILRNHGNGNVSLSACSAGLYLGYENSTFVNFLNGKGSLNSQGHLTLAGQINTGGKGTSTDGHAGGILSGGGHLYLQATNGSNIYFSYGTSTSATSRIFEDSSGVLRTNQTFIFGKVQDASGTANNAPALIVGGGRTDAHLELDSNEIMAKASGTTTAGLYLNSDGGTVYINNESTATLIKSISKSGTTTTFTQLNGGTVLISDTTYSAGAGLGLSSSNVFSLGGNIGSDITLTRTSGSGYHANFILRNDTSGSSQIALRVNNGTSSAAGLYSPVNGGASSNAKWLISVNTSGTVVVNTSDKREKNILGNMDVFEAETILRNINIINFIYKTDNTKTVQNGIIAQDLRDVLITNKIGFRPYLAIEDLENHNFHNDLNLPEDKVRYSIDYSKFTPILWKGWQIHDNKIKKL